MFDTTYLRFEENEPKPGYKTKTVDVISQRSGDILGIIKWFGRWRQYAFFPSDNTIYNLECLLNINQVLRALMDERKRRE